jgi:hypothetical protein
MPKGGSRELEPTAAVPLLWAWGKRRGEEKTHAEARALVRALIKRTPGLAAVALQAAGLPAVHPLASARAAACPQPPRLAAAWRQQRRCSSPGGRVERCGEAGSRGTPRRGRLGGPKLHQLHGVLWPAMRGDTRGGCCLARLLPALSAAARAARGPARPAPTAAAFCRLRFSLSGAAVHQPGERPAAVSGRPGHPHHWRPPMIESCPLLRWRHKLQYTKCCSRSNAERSAADVATSQWHRLRSPLAGQVSRPGQQEAAWAACAGTDGRSPGAPARCGLGCCEGPAFRFAQRPSSCVPHCINARFLPPERCESHLSGSHLPLPHTAVDVDSGLRT